jgi:hypothetical protein
MRYHSSAVSTDSGDSLFCQKTHPGPPFRPERPPELMEMAIQIDFYMRFEIFSEGPFKKFNGMRFLFKYPISEETLPPGEAPGGIIPQFKIERALNRHRR